MRLLASSLEPFIAVSFMVLSIGLLEKTCLYYHAYDNINNMELDYRIGTLYGEIISFTGRCTWSGEDPVSPP